MRLLLDENVADSTAELCRDLGYDVYEVEREGLEGEEDESLIIVRDGDVRVRTSPA